MSHCDKPKIINGGNYFAGPQEVINIYLLSLAFADLICGLVIVPLSIYPALESSRLHA